VGLNIVDELNGEESLYNVLFCQVLLV